jgi:hypothetical protein
MLLLIHCLVPVCGACQCTHRHNRRIGTSHTTEFAATSTGFIVAVVDESGTTCQNKRQLLERVADTDTDYDVLEAIFAL